MFLMMATTGCSLATTQKIPLVLLSEVPVPADARWAEEDEEEIGGDGGGGVLFFNFQADPTEGLFETLETDEVEAAEEGVLYYEGTENRTFFTLFALFFEGVSFDAKIVRLRAKPLPPEIGAPTAQRPPKPDPEVEPAEPAEPVEPEPVEVEPAAEVDEAPVEEPAVEEPPEEEDEPKAKKKKKRKKKKRKKRRKKGRR